MPIIDPWLPESPVPLVRPAIAIEVYRHTPGGPPYEPMSSLRCVSISQRVGPDPGTAVIRYAFDGRDPASPQSAEEALSTSVSLPKLVEVGDRLLVAAIQPSGDPRWIFDGRPLTWAVALHDGAEVVTMVCVGVAKACWDVPIPGAFMRNADDPGSEDDLQTDVIAHFNPQGQPNATPEDADATPTSGLNHPTFIGPYPPANKIKDATLRRWDLAMAACYILARCNDESAVKNPSGDYLDALLVSRQPKPSTPLDVNDPDTYEAKPLVVPDTPITGRDWPGALYDLVRHYAFSLYFQLVTLPDGSPETRLRLFLPQATSAKPLLLQARGAALDPALTNVGEAGLQRDLTEVANKWIVQGGPDRYEASFILEPLFPMAAADGATLSALKAFDRSSSTYASDDHDKYRLYGLDECGEGHYAPGTSTKLTDVPDLDDLFGTDAWVKRRRKPIGDLISTDPADKARRYSLSISKDYTGGGGLWDGTGTWQPVEGGYSLLKDRIGIRINVDNPNKWKIGPSQNATHPFPAGVVPGVEAQATTSSKNFHLRLTCVVEADKVLTAVADRRSNSPLTQTITRVVDARDRYRKEVVQKHSEFNNEPDDVVKRDDKEAAQAEADAVRFATDSGVLSGSVVIPRFTGYYGLGDRISSIEGRGLGLRTNNGGVADDAPIYPMVVARRWDFEPRQRTALELSDAGFDRRQYKRALRSKSNAR